MMRHLKVHGKIVLMKYASRMSYRADFVISVIAGILSQLTGAAFIGVAFFAGTNFPGWTFAQMMVMQGTLCTLRGLGSMCFNGLLWNTVRVVQKGRLEIMMIRPLNMIWFLTMEAFDEEDIGQLIGGLVLLATGIRLVGNIEGSIPLFVLLCLFGFAFFFSISLFFCAATIRFVNTIRLREFFDLLNILGTYPKSVYSRSAGIAMSTLMPLLIASFYPASALLGLSLEGAWMAAVSAVVFLVVSLYSVHAALKRYTGAGG